MKAILCTQYGGPEVLQLKEVAKPTPKDKEVLVRVRATSVNYGDLIARNFKDVTPQEFNMPWLLWLLAKAAFGFRNPNVTILGSEFAGEVEAVGKEVTSFKKGDQVFGHIGQNMGAYAEYFCMPENGPIAIKPANITHEEAAVVPYGAIMALPLLKKANIRPGQKVLIVGASGSIGSAAVQIAKHLGAQVTGVCGAQRVDFVKSLGADKVIDYTREDFTKTTETYDLILDVLGKSSFAGVQHMLKPTGILLFASFKTRHLLDMLRTSRSTGKKVICAFAPGSQEDLLTVKALIEAGKIKAIIDGRFPLAQTAEAHRYVETGHKKGYVAISVA